MILLITALLLILSVYLVFYQFGFLTSEKAHLPEHILKDKELDLQLLRKEEMGQPIFKTWLPLTKHLKPLEARIHADYFKKKLIKAGSPLGLFEFFAFNLLSVIFVPAVSLIALGNTFPQNTVFIISLAVGILLPNLWLNRKIKIRQHNIRRDLPNIIDLLNLCVGAGLDFMLAVNRVVRDLKPCDLTQELAEVYRQTQMGEGRKQALKNLAWRLDMPEIYSFVRTLVQADRMGSPIAEALKMQSEEIRVRRFQRGEAMALKAPIKLLLPLFVFILPVVLIIVGGPIILQFMRSSLGFGF